MAARDSALLSGLMNAQPTEKKTLGQIAYEADGFEHRQEQSDGLRGHYESVASAVRAAVLAELPEWGLVAHGKTQEGDESSATEWEKGSFYWEKCSPNIPVGMFNLVRRRLHRGEVCADDPYHRHGQKELLESEEPIWQLPPPPTGHQWHRTDGWTKEMLPEGWRPLLLGEKDCDEDEKRVLVTWVSTRGERHRAADSDWVHHRTRRPLPQSSEPTTEKLPVCIRCEQPIEGEMVYANDGSGSNFTHPECYYRKEVDRLTTENAALKQERDAAIARAQHAEESHELARQAVTEQRNNIDELEKELTRLRSQFRWTPISTPPATEDLAKPLIYAWGENLQHVATGKWGMGRPVPATHWSISPFTLPSPPETEEQAMRREFEAWWGAANDEPANDRARRTKQECWLAWQAAKQSTTQPEPATT